MSACASSRSSAGVSVSQVPRGRRRRGRSHNLRLSRALERFAAMNVDLLKVLERLEELIRANVLGVLLELELDVFRKDRARWQKHRLLEKIVDEDLDLARAVRVDFATEYLNGCHRISFSQNYSTDQMRRKDRVVFASPRNCSRSTPAAFAASASIVP